MVTKQQLKGLPEDADLRRADSLAREIFSDVANKWALLIIEALGERTLRFSELRNEVEGVSHKMLTQNLRMLERNGLVDRQGHPTAPPWAGPRPRAQGPPLQASTPRVSRAQRRRRPRVGGVRGPPPPPPPPPRG